MTNTKTAPITGLEWIACSAPLDFVDVGEDEDRVGEVVLADRCVPVGELQGLQRIDGSQFFCAPQAGGSNNSLGR